MSLGEEVLYVQYCTGVSNLRLHSYIHSKLFGPHNFRLQKAKPGFRREQIGGNHTLITRNDLQDRWEARTWKVIWPEPNALVSKDSKSVVPTAPDVHSDDGYLKS
jgi:hypothetical protein